MQQVCYNSRMFTRIGGRICGPGLLVLCLLLAAIPAAAQGEVAAVLSAPQLDQFPTISAYLDLRDNQGHFIHGLESEDLRVLEDEKSLPVSQLEELRPGAQIVIGVAPGPTFAVRNSQGISRYDYILEALTNWANSRRGTTIDDWSVVSTLGQEVAHSDDPSDWLEALSFDEEKMRETEPGVEALYQAVALASDPTPRDGMGRAVLYITPVLPGSLDLQNLSARAQELGIRIYVWLVTPVGAPLPPAAVQLTELSVLTGGDFANLTGEEEVPDPEAYVEPLRNIYKLSYNSQIGGSGEHTITVEAQTGAGTVSSQARSFSIEILPPNPAFLSHERHIVRMPPPSEDMPAYEIPVSEYLPLQDELQILIEFPDGILRSIDSATLFVDGKIEQTRTAPPFDQFTWDISQYDVTGEHMLQVRVRDELGLEGTSMETFVQVEVDPVQPTLIQSLMRYRGPLSALAAVVAGAGVLLALIIGRRIRPKSISLPANWQKRRQERLAQKKPQEESGLLPEWVNRLHWPLRTPAVPAQAFLTPMPDDDRPTPGAVPIAAEEITFGSDPSAATLFLEDASVDALHSRLVHRDGEYWVKDEGSLAGTYVNYYPVGAEGVVLEHGDMVHVGRVGFRFTLRNPDTQRKPVITPVGQNSDST